MVKKGAKDIFDADSSSESDDSENYDNAGHSELDRSSPSAPPGAENENVETEPIERNASEESGTEIDGNYPSSENVAMKSENLKEPDSPLATNTKRQSSYEEESDSDCCIVDVVARTPVKKRPSTSHEVIDLVSSDSEPDNLKESSSEQLKERINVPKPTRNQPKKPKTPTKPTQTQPIVKPEPGRKMQITIHCIIPGHAGTATYSMGANESFKATFRHYPAGAVFFGSDVSIVSFATPGALTDDDELKIIALTPKQFEEGDHYDISDNGSGDEQDSEVASGTAKENLLLVSINCPDGSRVSVFADKTKSVQKLLDFVRSEKNLDNSHTVALEFDGDPLDPKSLIGDTEMEDEDVLDAHY